MMMDALEAIVRPSVTQGLTTRVVKTHDTSGWREPATRADTAFTYHERCPWGFETIDR